MKNGKKIVDNGGAFGALLTDLSKAFDCIPHDLIIAKLEAYGFHIDTLKVIHDYLSNRKQRIKVNDAYSSGRIYFMVSHKDSYSVLCYPLYVLLDLFYFLEDLDIASDADDTTIYTVSEKKSQPSEH